MPPASYLEVAAATLFLAVVYVAVLFTAARDAGTRPASLTMN